MPDSVATAPSGKGVLSRAIGIIVSPGATYKEVLRSPRPVGILLLCCLVIAMATGLPQFTERGQQAALDMNVQNIERFTGRPVTPEMYTQMERQAAYGGYFAFVGVFVMMPVMSLIFTGVLWVVFNAILGGTATFKSVLTVVTHSQVIGALGAVAAAPIQYLQGTQNMAGPFNFGALAADARSRQLPGAVPWWHQRVRPVAARRSAPSAWRSSTREGRAGSRQD